MKAPRIIVLCLMTILAYSGHARAEETSHVVRLARLQIDPARLEAYKAVLREEIETSVRVEPGVLSLSAVSEKDHPERITILEVYADTEAYNAHLKSPHFTRYKTAVESMVKALDLAETVPVAIATKMK